MIDVIPVPSPLGLGPAPHGGPPGVHQLPAVLTELGLLDGLDVSRRAPVPVPAWSGERDAATLVRNPAGLRAVAQGTADAVGDALSAGRFALVLGGDCSILLGSALGLRRRGRYGLVFLDGHADFYVPRHDLGGGAAGMDLALVTGRGPTALTGWGGLGPLLRDDDVAVVGYRDEQESQELGMPSLGETDIATVSLRELREAPPRETLDVALRQAAGGTDGFFVHLDADVLADEVMPAVDSRQPGGMTYDELASLLPELVAHPSARGLEITIYDPSLDPDRRYGRPLAQALNAALSGLPPEPS